MNEITPKGLGRGGLSTSGTHMAGRRSTRSSPALFHGLRIVLHECDRRGAVMRSLASVRWLAQRGAEVVLFDGTGSRRSADGTQEAVARRFPFVTLAGPLKSGSGRGFVDQVVAPRVPDDGTLGRISRWPTPSWILALSADVEIDRFQTQHLLDEIRELPSGSLLIPRVHGTDGRPVRRTDRAGLVADVVTGTGMGAWLARRSDLARIPFDRFTMHLSTKGAVLARRQASLSVSGR